MDGINTAEQFLLAEYEKLQKENDNLRDELDALKSVPDGLGRNENPIEHNVSIYKLDEPIELVYLGVESCYTMRNSDQPLKLTADEIREHIGNGTLREIADMRCGYSASPLMCIDILTFPYTLQFGGCRFGLDVNRWSGKSPNVSVCECLEDSELRANAYFPAEREQELFEYGLERMKEQLEKHLEWLEKEGKSGKWWKNE